MYTTKDLINDYEQFISWVEKLKYTDERLHFQSIREGKWSVAEIIAHIMFWDKYILEETLPKMKKDANVKSADFQEINDLASDYALSKGMTFNRLVDELIHYRMKLAQRLKEKKEEAFFDSFKLNGEAIDTYSGYPHSIFNYFCAFIWHDNHHKEQIEKFLKDNLWEDIG